MASSAQSGGTSGGPAVPTVQRGIVKMVRAGPGTLTPPTASGRVLALAPLPLPPVCMVSQIPFPLFPYFSLILGIPFLDGIQHGIPLVLCFPDTLAPGVAVISVVAALRSAVYQDRSVT